MDKWKCVHKCDQAAAIKATGRYCVHLEALLGASSGLGSRYSTGLDDRAGGSPSPEDLLIRHQDDAQIARALGLDESEPLSDEETFRLKLRKNTSLSELKIDILTARLVRGLSFKEIAIEQGYAQASVAARAFNDALEMVKRSINGKS